MKIFQCKNCSNPIFFENTFCGSCNNNLGYLHSDYEMYSSPHASNFVINNTNYTYCQNHRHKACNWLVPEHSFEKLCLSCSFNRTIPNLSNEENYDRWRIIEEAKRRLVYSLLRFNLPLLNRLEDPENGLFFDFLSPTDRITAQPAVRTGHDSGVITINIEEADSAHREFMRKEMHEPYRTLIGHFRHEVGHYYWDLLIWKNINLLADFRFLFGDERMDYGDALKTHYNNGAPDDWQSFYISEYATSHPWEDWAETWSHYHHLVDTLETAYAFGISLSPILNTVTSMNMQATFNPYFQENFDKIIGASVPLSFAVNSINRSMGQPDLYPFVLNSSVVDKLRFVHRIVHSI